MNKDFIAGSLDNIGFVCIETKYKDKWVLCFHKKRQRWGSPRWPCRKRRNTLDGCQERAV